MEAGSVIVLFGLFGLFVLYAIVRNAVLSALKEYDSMKKFKENLEDLE